MDASSALFGARLGAEALGKKACSTCRSILWRGRRKASRGCCGRIDGGIAGNHVCKPCPWQKNKILGLPAAGTKGGSPHLEEGVCPHPQDVDKKKAKKVSTELSTGQNFDIITLIYDPLADFTSCPQVGHVGRKLREGLQSLRPQALLQQHSFSIFSYLRGGPTEVHRCSTGFR
jgi:hypothetical protein